MFSSNSSEVEWVGHFWEAWLEAHSRSQSHHNPWTEWSSPRRAGRRAHTLSCCRACISIYSFSISFTGDSESHHSVCVFFLSFGLEKRWDFSEQILLSPSTATLWVQTVTTWRMNLLQKEGQSNILVLLFPPAWKLWETAHTGLRRARVAQKYKRVPAVPRVANVHRPPSHCQLWCDTTHTLVAQRLSFHGTQTSCAWCAVVLLFTVVEF